MKVLFGCQLEKSVKLNFFPWKRHSLPSCTLCNTVVLKYPYKNLLKLMKIFPCFFHQFSSYILLPIFSFLIQLMVGQLLVLLLVDPFFYVSFFFRNSVLISLDSFGLNNFVLPALLDRTGLTETNTTAGNTVIH